MITKAKKNDLAAKKSLAAFLPMVAVRKLVAEIAPRFKDRNGGYTRIAKLGPRVKDGAPMAVVELLDRPVAIAPAAAKAAKAGKKASKKEAKMPKENA